MAIIFVVLTLLVLAFAIRSAAAKEFIWCFVPLNTFAIVVSKGNETTDMTRGGGGIVRILHNVPGKRLDMTSANPMDWKFVPEQGQVEKRSILFLLLGVQYKGLFTSLRLNKVRSQRYGRVDKQNKTGMISKDFDTKFVFYSGENAYEVTAAETAGMYSLNWVFNLIFEANFPVRVVVRLADSSEYLGTMIRGQTIIVTGTEQPEAFLYGTENEANKKKVTDKIMDIAQIIERELGIVITNVNVANLDPEEAQRANLELKKTTELQNAAEIQKAKKDAEVQVLEAGGYKQAKILRNDADADHVQRVIVPTAASELTVAVRMAEAYENNETVQATGTNLLQLLPELKKKDSDSKAK